MHVQRYSNDVIYLPLLFCSAGSLSLGKHDHSNCPECLEKLTVTLLFSISLAPN